MSRKMEEQDFYNYMMEFYDLFDEMTILKSHISGLQPHIQNMLDRGFGHIVDEVIADRQKAGNV